MNAADAAQRADAVRRGAGLFRLRDRALLAVRGGDRVRWLDGMLSNDVARLAPGPSRSGCYALLLSPQSAENPIERARRLGAEAINPWRGLVRRELVEAAHEAGLAVYVFTVDDVAEMERLLALGVDGLFTNYPDRMRALLRG